jgi:hypothetical protein
MPTVGGREVCETPKGNEGVKLGVLMFWVQILLARSHPKKRTLSKVDEQPWETKIDVRVRLGISRTSNPGHGRSITGLLYYLRLLDSPCTLLDRYLMEIGMGQLSRSLGANILLASTGSRGF